jgi:membrane associated rhomboid family serine protease
MFFFLPTGVDRTITRTPWVTYLLLIGNVAAYVLQHWVLPSTEGLKTDEVVLRYAFSVADPTVLQAFTHLFTHAGLLHLLPNLLFLYLIGATVEDRVGPFRMAGFYLLGGLAGLGLHAWSVWGKEAAAIPLMGASGAIAGLMGMFTVLMPWTDIKVYYAYMIGYRYTGSGTAHVPSLLFLGVYFFVSDVIWAFVTLSSVRTPVAYWAHVGGFGFGALLAGCLYGFQALWTSEAEMRRRERQISRSLQQSVNNAEHPERSSRVGGPAASRREAPLPTLPPRDENPTARAEIRSTHPGVAPAPATTSPPRGLLSITAFTETVPQEPVARQEPSLQLLPRGSSLQAPGSVVIAREDPSTSAGERPSPLAPYEAVDPVLAKLGRDLAEGELRHIAETPPPHGARAQRLPLTPNALCTLMLLPAPHLAMDRVLRSLQTVLHSPADRIASRLRQRAGILYTHVAYEDGALMRERLAETGVPALLVENRLEDQPLEATLPQRLEVTPGAWHWRTAAGWTETRTSDLTFAVAGRVRVAPADPMPANVLDLHFLALGRRMRLLRAVQPHASGGGADADDAVGGQPLWEAAAQMLAAAPDAQRSAALESWVRSKGAPETLPLFKNVAVYDHLNYWHHLLWLAPSVEA